MVFLFFILTLLCFLSYSFVLIDPNITLFNHQLWAIARDKLVQFGYFHRDISTLVYIVLVMALFVLHFFFIKNFKKYDPVKVAFVVGSILLLSYPFLSRDFFNYIFDARIITHYGQNPYFYRPLDFPADHWLRFMNWVHRTYPYGPIFLPLTLIPSFLAFGKFILNYIFFKGLSVIFYIIAVYFLKKSSKRAALIFATSPLVIIEGLVSSHNDIIAISLAFVGIYFLLNKKSSIWTRVFFLLSGGIKYITLPLVFLQSKKNSRFNLLVLVGVSALVVGASLKLGIQPWYFLNLFVLLPFYESFISRLNILFCGLLLSYYPFIRYGDWKKIEIKNNIILVAISLNLLYWIFLYIKCGRKADFLANAS